MVGEDFTQDVKLMKGNLKLIIERGEYYVVGEGLFLPVKSYQEGIDLLNEIEEKKAIPLWYSSEQRKERQKG